MHLLKPVTFILLSSTHLLVMWKNKSMLVLMDFPLLSESSHSIYETNSVHHRASGKWEKEIHTQKTRNHVWHHPCTHPLASCCPCLNAGRCFSVGLVGLGFSFLLPVPGESASLESPASWVGDWSCCCRLRSRPAWSNYWHLHVCGVAASSYSFLFPALHSSSPMGPAPLAGTPKSSVNALADPFP